MILKSKRGERHQTKRKQEKENIKLKGNERRVVSEKEKTKEKARKRQDKRKACDMKSQA